MTKQFLMVPIAVATLLLVGGCAPMISGAMNLSVTDAVVEEKTAKYFGASPKDITISGIEKRALATVYQARYLGKLYNCQVYYGEVICKQPGS